MTPLSQSSIIVCGIVKNAEIGLKKNIPVINRICRLSKDYRIIIYENDSTDSTKKLLSDWAEIDRKRIHVLLDETNHNHAGTIPKRNNSKVNPFFSRQRIEKMAQLRNKYMQYIDQQAWTSDYVIVVDLDVASLFEDAILTSFSSKIEWDAVTSFGYSTSPKFQRRYHDTYALTELGDENMPQTEYKIKVLADKYGKLTPKDDWVRVYSAYGGLAIYKFDAIKGLKYLVYGNDDEQVEVKCEHFSIYSQMYDRGFTKIYINPAMILKYQALTLDIVKNTLARKLFH